MDVIGILSGKSLLSHVAEMILVELDAKSLLNCEQVSTEWFTMVTLVWKDYFKKQRKTKSLFHRYFQLRRLDRTLNLVTADASLCKLNLIALFVFKNCSQN